MTRLLSSKKESLIQIRIYKLVDQAIDDRENKRMCDRHCDLGTVRRETEKNPWRENEEERSDKEGHQKLHISSRSPGIRFNGV